MMRQELDQQDQEYFSDPVSAEEQAKLEYLYRQQGEEEMMRQHEQ